MSNEEKWKMRARVRGYQRGDIIAEKHDPADNSYRTVEIAVPVAVDPEIEQLCADLTMDLSNICHTKITTAQMVWMSLYVAEAAIQRRRRRDIAALAIALIAITVVAFWAALLTVA
jgi:hypothetical protein